MRFVPLCAFVPLWQCSIPWQTALGLFARRCGGGELFERVRESTHCRRRLEFVFTQESLCGRTAAIDFAHVAVVNGNLHALERRAREQPLAARVRQNLGVQLPI